MENADKYALLSASEEQAGDVARNQQGHDADSFLTEVPDDAPPPPQAHPRLGLSTNRWAYLRPDGRNSFFAVRFDKPNGGKEVLPLTLWRKANGDLRWIWKAAPAPRSLYGLEQLDTQTKQIVVVEGEKAADAARVIFPYAACVTSAGGSSAFAQTDWSPLAKRRVLIWPDADEPGRAYAAGVASILSDRLGAEVCILDGLALASIAPDGSSRDPVVGWDAADALSEWSDHDTLRKTIASVTGAPIKPKRFLSYGHFKMTDEGLFSTKPKRRGADDVAAETWLAAPFEVVGAARDPHGSGWGKLLRWRDADGRDHTRVVTDARLHGEPGLLCASLADEGLHINRNFQREFVSYLAGCLPETRVTILPRTGWHEVDNRMVFALPGGAISASSSSEIILDAAAQAPYASAGTLADWQRSVAEPACGQRLPMLALCIALAGPLLKLAGQDGGGVHFYGQSSRGKTTLLDIAASVWGSGGSSGFVRSWRATANGLEGAAAGATDTLLALDELGVAADQEVAQVVYGIANGVGKQRATRTGELRAPKSWRVLIISSGELPLPAKIQEGGRARARAGHMVRLIDIEADAGQGLGVFDSTGEFETAAQFAGQFKQAARTVYGTAGPAFVKGLIDARVDPKDVTDGIQSTFASGIDPDADGQIHRTAGLFSLIAVAGEMAIELGILPWPSGSAREACEWALDRMIAARGGVGSAEARQAIECVRLFLTQHGASRFEDLDTAPDENPVRPVINRVGWRTGKDEDKYTDKRAAFYWLIPSESWRDIVCQGHDPHFVARTLRDAGFLKPGKDAITAVRKIRGESMRVYVISSRLLADTADEA